MGNNELIRDNIVFLKDYIPKLIMGIEKEVNYLIINNETDSQLMLEIIEGLEWTIRSIKSLESFGYDLNNKLNQMNQILEEATQAFQRKDYVLLSDLLQYEIAELLKGWNKKIESIFGDFH